MKNIKAIVHRKGCGRKSGPQGLKKDLPVVHLHATQGNPDSIPARAGIGLRAPHYQDILTLLPGIGWIEVHSENYFGPGGAPLFYLQQVRKHYPLSLHGVGLSLGSTDALNIRHLEKLKGLIDRFEPRLVSDHGAHTGIGVAIAYTLASVGAAVVVNYTRCSQDPGEGHLTRHDQDHLQSRGLG